MITTGSTHGFGGIIWAKHVSPHRHGVGAAVQPDVIFIAADSRRRDRFDKRDLYEKHGVREYLLIDPEAETVEVLWLQDGEYQLVGRWRSGAPAASCLLQGFVVTVGDLFAEA